MDVFDLQAQKLLEAVAAVRDSAEAARVRARLAAEGLIAMSSGIGGLLIAYLIWYPALGGIAIRPGQPLSRSQS